jgi:hypothetical protein
MALTKMYVSVTFDWNYWERNRDRKEELEEIMQSNNEYLTVDGFDQGLRCWHLYLEIRARDLPLLKAYLEQDRDFQDYLAIEV